MLLPMTRARLLGLSIQLPMGFPEAYVTTHSFAPWDSPWHVKLPMGQSKALPVTLPMT